MIRCRPQTVFTRAALGIVCALLLFAQQLGLSHAVWHATQQVPSTLHVSDAFGGDPAQLPHASKLCPLDAALGQVLGGGCVSDFKFELQPADAHTFAVASAPLASGDSVTPRSRGPPALPVI